MIQPLFVFSIGPLLYFKRAILPEIRVFPYEMSTNQISYHFPWYTIPVNSLICFFKVKFFL